MPSKVVLIVKSKLSLLSQWKLVAESRFSKVISFFSTNFIVRVMGWEYQSRINPKLPGVRSFGEYSSTLEYLCILVIWCICFLTYLHSTYVRVYLLTNHFFFRKLLQSFYFYFFVLKEKSSKFQGKSWTKILGSLFLFISTRCICNVHLQSILSPIYFKIAVIRILY